MRGCWGYANQTVAIGYEVSPNKSPRGSDPGTASTAAVAGVITPDSHHAQSSTRRAAACVAFPLICRAIRTPAAHKLGAS